MKNNVTITEHGTEWISTLSVPDDYISTTTHDLISKPAFIVSTTDDETTNNLYTKEQMFEMFRLGYRAKRLGAYSILRKLEVGEKAYFPYEAWNSARTAASQLERNFGTEFQVRKTGRHGDRSQIEVTRKA